MGEIADDMVDGTICSLCGMFFDGGKDEKTGQLLGYTHDYPVVCWDCWKRMPKPHRRQYARAEVKTIGGDD